MSYQCYFNAYTTSQQGICDYSLASTQLQAQALIYQHQASGYIPPYWHYPIGTGIGIPANYASCHGQQYAISYPSPGWVYSQQHMNCIPFQNVYGTFEQYGTGYLRNMPPAYRPDAPQYYPGDYCYNPQGVMTYAPLPEAYQLNKERELETADSKMTACVSNLSPLAKEFVPRSRSTTALTPAEQEDAAAPSTFSNLSALAREFVPR